MYRVIILLSLIALLVVATYLLLAGEPYLSWFGLCLIPIFWAGYLFGFRFAALCSLVATLFAFWYLLSSPKDWLWLVVVAGGFGLAIFLTHQLAQISEGYRNTFRTKLNGVNRSYKKFKNKDEKVVATCLRLDQDVAQIVSLYQVTKDMGGSLGYSDIFAIFSGALRKTFDFERSKLILLDETKRPASIERIYQISKGQAPGVPEVPSGERGRAAILARELRVAPVEVNQENFDRKLAKALFEAREPIVITTFEVVPRGVGLILPEEVGSIIACPLTVEGKITAVVTMENFKGEVYDKFLILAGQLALEIKKVRLYEKVQELAIVDGLTGVYLRRHFLERYDKELKRSKRHGFNLSFFMVDIDNFKRYNDKYGHLVGDVALQEVAEILKNSIRTVDLVCRYGGEEFAVILPQTDKEGALQVAERIRWAADNHRFKAYDQVTKVTVSIGVATFPEDAKDMDELIERADEAMYKAKKKGRNRVVIYKKGRK